MCICFMRRVDLHYSPSLEWEGGGGRVAQLVEHAVPGEDVPGSIPAVASAPYWLGRCQYNVTD